MSLRKKLFNIFDVYYGDETSDLAIIKDMDRRGKITNKKVAEMLFLFIDEIGKLNEKIAELEAKSTALKSSKK